MKVTAAATLLVLTTLSSAAPATHHVRRQAPNAVDVMNSVNSWTNDVNQVNSFLNTASTLSGAGLAAAAQTAFGFASNEPVQLMFEAGLPGLSQAGMTAAADLMQVFQVGVLDQLQNIINDPNNNDTVQESVDTINDTRCLRVLPDVDILWPAAFAAVSISPPPSPAQRENACATITVSAKA